MLRDQDKNALLSLLDDPSPLVRKALLKALEKWGAQGLDFLRETAHGPNRLLGQHASSYLSELQKANPAEAFKAFIREKNYELASGWILMGRVAHPESDIGELYGQLDRISHRCKELIAPPVNAREVCLVLNRVLFHELGFRGNVSDYANPDNSFLCRVLENRKGLPIALSVLYLLVAERLGASLEPISAPHHFVVGCFAGPFPFYIDPFEHGKFLSASQMMRRLEASGIAPDLSHLAPATTQEVLERMCRNLVNHYALAKEERLSELFQQFLQEFAKARERDV